MRTARSGTRFLSSAASTLAARWRASVSGYWCDRVRSRALLCPATRTAAHSAAVNSKALRHCMGPTPKSTPHALIRPLGSSTLAAVDEALQHRREQLGGARADGLIFLPRAVAGNVQPGRVLIEGELAH